MHRQYINGTVGTFQTETQHTPEKASHNMLETQVNSHCNVTIIGYFYQLDIELMLHAPTMISMDPINRAEFCRAASTTSHFLQEMYILGL